MLELKTKQKLAGEAHKLAQGFNLVRYRSVTYIPADYETRDVSNPPASDRTIWLPMGRREIQTLAAGQFNTLFASDGELASFDFMVAQSSNQQNETIESLLVATSSGLCELNEKGQLVDVTGQFRPNTLVPMINDDQAEKDRVFNLISEWLQSDDEARSLLSHLATCLSPGWSAVKYVLLLGEGRNGKGLMLRMLQGLFGRDNVSNVTRQAMSESSPTVTELNGKLLNIVFDGRADYMKDSANEKSLVAGEPVSIRRLYESTATTVQTNSLFVEGLNKEPKTGDKSVALQKRLVRFQFPNIYDLDHVFARSMLKMESLGALVSLLLDHYVCEDEVAKKLAPTTRAIELQLDQMYSNSIGLQFLKYYEETDPLGAVGLLGMTMHELVQLFQSWRLKENDLGTWAEPDVQALFQPLLNTERKTQRNDAGQPRKIRVVVSYKQEASAFIDSLKGTDDDAALLDTLVED